MQLPAGNTQWLGASYDHQRKGTHFVFYAAASATKVELCLFNESKETRCELTEKEAVKDASGHVLGYVYNGFASGLGEGELYGFRVHGPYHPDKNQFFNPQKLLVDPCARAVTDEIHQWQPAHYPSNNEDNAAIMPKARVVDWRALQHDDHRTGALYPHADTNILEVHVRGATILHPDIPEKERGTYKGLCDPAFMQWVKDMGFTSLELMPVESFGTDAPLADRGKKNYWGYMTMAATAAHTAYASTPAPEKELASAIKTLRANGIEVIMDVVPNHTLESGHDGPVVNLRGMDANLYLHKRDYTGTGNTRDFGHPINRRLFLEELKYWKSVGVSGFRIDLATVIGREGGSDFNPDSDMMKIIRHDPELKNVKFYGEPWDLGPGACFGEQIGRLSHHPAAENGAETNPISEWDGKLRDMLEQAALNHDIALPRNALVKVLAGHSETYPNPQHHVVKFGSHDGATPADRVSYTSKQNHPNGEDNRDGNELSPACYWGKEDDRQRVQRFAIALLALAQGPHMMTLGHERGMTQKGNTNPYCQDNETTYVPWADRISPEGRALMEFTRTANQLYQQHHALRRGHKFTGQSDTASDLRFQGKAIKDVTWLDPNAQELSGDAMDQHGGFGMMLSGDPGNNSLLKFGATRKVDRLDHGVPLLVLVNPTLGDMEFSLPHIEGVKWTPKLNSENPAQLAGLNMKHDKVKIGWRGLMIFEGQRERMHGAGDMAAKNAAPQQRASGR